MLDVVCPHEEGLDCTQSERLDEFYRQMDDAMLQNKTVYFLTGGECPVSGFTCAKLRDFRARQQKQR